MGRFENKWIVSCRILFSSDLNLTKRTRGIFIPWPFFPVFSSIFHTTEIWIRTRESISKKGLTVGVEIIASIVIWFDIFRSITLVNWVKDTEREGFEPSVNKSLHSSSNATPWTTRPSRLHNDYGLETEWIVIHSY